MTEISVEDRRIDEINKIKERIIKLESVHEDLVRSKVVHEGILERLLDQDQKLTIALNSIGSKFDSLIDKISLGFKLITIGCMILSSLFGGFWVYSKDLDNKYLSENKIISRHNEFSEDSAKTISNQLEKLNKIQQDIEELKNK